MLVEGCKSTERLHNLEYYQVCSMTATSLLVPLVMNCWKTGCALYYMNIHSFIRSMCTR